MCSISMMTTHTHSSCFFNNIHPLSFAYYIFFIFLLQSFWRWDIPSHENWPTQFQKLINAFFNKKKLYLLLHISLPLLSQQIQIEKKPAPGDYEFNLKFYRSIGLSRKCRNANFFFVFYIPGFKTMSPILWLPLKIYFSFT